MKEMPVIIYADRLDKHTDRVGKRAYLIEHRIDWRDICPFSSDSPEEQYRLNALRSYGALRLPRVRVNDDMTVSGIRSSILEQIISSESLPEPVRFFDGIVQPIRKDALHTRQSPVFYLEWKEQEDASHLMTPHYGAYFDDPGDCTLLNAHIDHIRSGREVLYTR